jgi:hypothetical protein
MNVNNCKADRLIVSVNHDPYILMLEIDICGDQIIIFGDKSIWCISKECGGGLLDYWEYRKII